jgi:hypothetical protein
MEHTRSSLDVFCRRSRIIGVDIVASLNRGIIIVSNIVLRASALKRRRLRAEKKGQGQFRENESITFGGEATGPICLVRTECGTYFY